MSHAVCQVIIDEYLDECLKCPTTQDDQKEVRCLPHTAVEKYLKPLIYLMGVGISTLTSRSVSIDFNCPYSSWQIMQLKRWLVKPFS